ncbi:hypothetical protein ALO79_200262 [Pseudomonas syringae pv. castaneae]|uniref:Uncharacterized protein n=1 Tax=Pseudomonas syringae pv. castaneae TaxID=264450 RepID=A0A0P9MRP2_PSESX|nr:hypothetical protein ALO79_200262 [Pseudomonas syringae pv. castaneae]
MYPVEQRLLALAEQPFDLPTLERLARFQRRGEGPLLQLDQRIADARFAQRIDPYQQGTGVVLAAGQVRGVDQRLGGKIQVRLVPKDAGNGRIPQNRPDAIAEQHESLFSAQFAVEEIQNQMLIQPQGALEHMLHALLLPDVILADPLQMICMPAVDPAIAHVGEGEAPASQHQGTDGGEQRLPAPVGL